MAAGVTAESVLGSIIQGHLECSICRTRYQEPKMLDCSHNFCCKCLHELKKRQNPDSDKMMCPLCQRETVLPKGGVTKLPGNYTLNSLVEEVTNQERLLKDEGSSKVICQACEEENEAISQCMDCEHYLCEECQKAHQRLSALRAHKITSLAKLKKEGSIIKTEHNIPNCVIHPNQKLVFYCVSCEQLICKFCATSSHRKPMHNFVDFKTAMAVYLQAARDMATEVRKRDAFLKTEISTNWESLRNRLSIMLTTTKCQISQKAEMEVAKIRQKEMQLLQQAQVTFRQKDKKLAALTFAEHTVKRVHSDMTDENRYKILNLRQQLLRDYRDVCEDHAQDVTHDLSFIAFKEDEDGLGTLLLEEKWELLSESDVTGSSIASLSTGDVVVVDDEEETKQLTKLSPSGDVLYSTSIDHIHQISNKIAVNKSDHLLVLDSSAVKIFNEEFQLLSEFTPGKESDIDSAPTCLAVDDSNLIAVGYKDKEEISLHNPDGSLIRTLPAPMIDNNLTISNQHLIYFSPDDYKLMSIDFMGNKTFTLTVDDEYYHGQVCCDKAGDIYVLASHADFGSKVHHYSAEGKYIESVITDDDEQCHWVLTYSPVHGRLAMTGTKSTQIYHRV